MKQNSLVAIKSTNLKRLICSNKDEELYIEVIALIYDISVPAFTCSDK